jgi:hypothetical protein
LRGTDQFHAGIVVEDFEAALADLSELFGYVWCEPISVSTPVVLPTGDLTLHLTFTYSMTSPRLEVIRCVPGTLWTPVVGSGIHHLGYWSDDVAADSSRLVERGYAAEATGVRPDGLAGWAYHRGPAGPRIEIVSRQLQPALEQYWVTGGR